MQSLCRACFVCLIIIQKLLVTRMWHAKIVIKIVWLYQAHNTDDYNDEFVE